MDEIYGVRRMTSVPRIRHVTRQAFRSCHSLTTRGVLNHGLTIGISVFPNGAMGAIHGRYIVSILLQDVGFSSVRQPLVFNQVAGKCPRVVGK